MPSLRMSGGNKEIVRLVQEMMANGGMDAVIVAMWKHAHSVETGGIPVVYLLDAEPSMSKALAQLPAIAIAFRRFLGTVLPQGERPVHLLLSHYVTYLLAWVAPTYRRICFNQDLEWLFVRRGWRRSLLKWAILSTNRRSAVVTANTFVTESYRALGVELLGEASIWAEPRWLAPQAPEARDIDVLMLLRESGIKRLDLYLKALRLFQEQRGLRTAVITPDSSIPPLIPSGTAQAFLRPSDAEMQTLFGRSRLFLLLSDVEGFGLPPLEAMGSGCVPACRDSGGVRCYMRGVFADLLFPLETPVEQIVDAVTGCMRSGDLPDADAARNAFAAGLEASRDSREECVRLLRQHIGAIADEANG